MKLINHKKENIYTLRLSSFLFDGEDNLLFNLDEKTLTKFFEESGLSFSVVCASNFEIRSGENVIQVVEYNCDGECGILKTIILELF